MSRLKIKFQRNLLVFGFTRFNSFGLIPTDLMKLCFQYYNDIIDWTLSADSLQKFLNAKYDECLCGPTFKIHNIPFQLILYPNGNKSSKCKGYVSFFLVFLKDKLPSNIIDFSICADLFCSETKVEWKAPLTMKYIWNKRGKSRVGWFRYNMPVKQFDKNRAYKFINFGCYIDPIYIKYADLYKNISLQHNNISLCMQYEYEWKLTNEDNYTILDALKTSSKGQCYYSPSFNGDCFCIVIIPKGRIADKDENNIRVFIKLLKLPLGISYIVIKYKLNVCSQIESDNMEYESTAKLGYMMHDRSVSCSTLSYVPSKHIFETHLSIKAVIQITTVFDENELIVEQKHWSNYN